MKSNYYCVIMAGGVGSRFWPMSTSKFPKQFHDVIGTGRTLIQQTYDRLQLLVPKENIYVITNQDFEKLTQDQLPELNVSQIIGEPYMKNTAACVNYMAEKIYQLNPNSVMMVAPADHIILDPIEFIRYSNMAFEKAEKEEVIVTLGIKPTRPDTGYGYIQYFKESENPINKVKTFTEKPTLEIAQQFLDSGDFLWNAGIFVWSTNTILKSFEQYLPEMFQSFQSIKSYNTENEIKDLNPIYQTIQNISIDFGILEKAKNVHVIPSSFGWSDLGTWKSLFENCTKDEDGNAINAYKVKTYNSNNNIIRSTQKKAIIIDGLEDYIVVDTESALLIIPLANDQEIKNYVQDLKLNKGEEFL